MMKQTVNYLLLICTLFAFTCVCVSCDDDEEEYVDYVWTVAPHKVDFIPPVLGEPCGKGYQVTDEKGLTYVVQTIHGFEGIYQEGYEYVICVRYYKKKEIWEDDIAEYHLVKVIECHKTEDSEQ
ncbi:MAG: hypothetical protein J6B91_10165 [Prevotella sp.]|nr:hypothetical protein [Prevotella sp.]